MTLFQITEIVNGDTVRVSPDWVFGNQQGNLVQIFGYRTPEGSNLIFAKNKLNNLLHGKFVELREPAQVRIPGLLTCRMYLNQVDVSLYFPEFKSY